MIYGIDPGPFVSHVVGFDGKQVTRLEELDNESLVNLLGELKPARYAIEDFVPYGSPVSADSIRTIKVIGVAEFLGVPAIDRKAIKLHLCGTLQQIKDKQVREALIERFGPGQQAAKGTAKHPGPLHRVSGHYWAALAVAVVAWDQGVQK